MNKNLKNTLKEVFEAPTPIKKKAFLRNIQISSIGYFEFVFSQVTYIRKWIWIFSFILFSASLIGATYLEKDMLWSISAFMPVLALSVITESGRSEFYGVAELEMSTRFSLKSVILARLGILGISNLIIMCLLVPLAFANNKFTILQTGVYLLCPYLLTTFGGLLAIRKLYSKDGIYLCISIAIVISITNMITYQSFSAFYKKDNFIFWIVALISFGIGTIKESYKLIKQTEELVWNS